MYGGSSRREQKVKNIVGSLSTWRTAGIEPSIHGRDDKSIQLDRLARVLTQPKDTCVALCLWGGELLVASNRKVPESAAGDLKKWREFAKFKSNGLELLKIALKKANLIVGKEIEKVLAVLGSEGQRNLRVFRELANKRVAVPKEIMSSVENIFKFSAILREDGNVSLANKMWDFISPIEDSNKMMELVVEGELDKLLFDAICNNNVALIESEENIHAEMKIIDYVLSSTKEKGYFYIGIGKLCCLPCKKVVDVVNEFNNYRIGVPGTHGKTYPNWRLLEVFENNSNYNAEYERLERVLTRISEGKYAQHVRESTCRFPDSLTSLNLEEIFFTHQEQPPKPV